MKKKKRNKALAILVAFAMVFTMMPAAAFAMDDTVTSTKVQQDSQGRDYYTEIELKPHTFYDVAGGARQKFNDELITKVVKDKLLWDWVDIANGCLRTGGEAASRDYYRYGSAFNYDNASYNCFGEIRKYLRDEAGAKNKGSYSRDSLWKTGLKSTDSLANVRLIMAEQIKNQIDHKPLHTEDILKQGPEKDSVGCALPEMKENTKKQKVVYSIVTSINEKSKYSNTYAYNSFGIAFYDFKPRAIQAKNLVYKSAGEKYDSAEEAVKKGAPGVTLDTNTEATNGVAIKNESARPVTQSLSYADSHRTEVTNSTAKTSEHSYGESIGVTTKWDTGKLLTWMGAAGIELSIKAQFNQAYSTTTTETKAISDEYKVENTQSITAEPQTMANMTTAKTNMTIKEEYDTPVMFSFKVAIFSLTGDVYADNAAVCSFATAGYDHGFYYCEIGGDSENGISAPENLYRRVVENQKTGNEDTASGAIVHKWHKRNGGSYFDKTREGVDWNSGFIATDGATRGAVERSYSRIPMLSGGCEYTLSAASSINTVGDLTPLYLPRKFVLSKGEGSYHLSKGNTLNLSRQLGVSCLSKNEIAYYGFSPTDGQWVVCDEQGNLTDTSCVSIQVNGAGDQILSAKEPGKAYVTWKMKDNVTYMSQEESGSVTAESKLPAPIIEIETKDDPFEGSLKISGSFEGCVGDKQVNLNDSLKVSAYDKTGKQVKVPVKWQAKELSEVGIEVSENGDIVMTKPGDFNVRVFVDNENAGTDPVYSEFYQITVRDRRTLENVVFDPSVENNEVLKTNTPDGTIHRYDLDSFVRGFDQYGDPWKGDLDGVSYAINSENEENAYIEDGKLYITGEGGFDIDLMLNDEICEGNDFGSTGFNLKAEDNIRCNDQAMNLTYGQTRKIDVRDGEGKQITEGITYISDNPDSVTVSANGTAKAVGVGYARITITDEYGGREIVGIEVTRAENPLAIKGKTAVVKGSTKGKKGKLKKTKTLEVTKVIAFAKKGQGKMTFTKTSGNKKITINKTTGKVTVKKGLKKGTYRVKAKVTAAGNNNYKDATRYVTFKIRVR